jgi:hypothetical protein
MREHAQRGRPVAPGTYIGRWKVLRMSAPLSRPWWSGTLARVYCRCVCGHEKPVWDRDLKLGRSTGCRSKACRNTWAFAEHLVPALGIDQAREIARAMHEAEVSTYHVIRKAAERLGITT